LLLGQAVAVLLRRRRRRGCGARWLEVTGGPQPAKGAATMGALEAAGGDA